MSVTFKKQFRKNPLKPNEAGKYYPYLIVWGNPANLDSITAEMKDKSSLSEGDIKSVLTNFVSCMRKELYNGRSVNIENFGVVGYDAFYGFLCGICAGNYDVTDILVDSTFKICPEAIEGLEAFTKKLQDLSEWFQTHFRLRLRSLR